MKRNTEEVKPRHTPTPWQDVAISGVRHDHDGFTVWTHWLPDQPSEQRRANVEFIVRAVNCHEELIEALKAVVAVADRKTVEFDQARAAIAKAEGGVE